MSEGERPTVLTYGKRPTQVFGLRRLVVSFAVMVVLLIVAPRVQSWINGQWALHRAIVRCLEYSIPAVRVVYEEDAPLAKSLSHGQTSGLDWSTTSSGGQIVGYSAIPPQSLNRLNGWGGPGIFPYSPNLVFLHGVRSAAGHERLVYVAVSGTFALRQGTNCKLTPGAPAEFDVLDWLVVDPGSTTQPSKVLTRDSYGDGNLWIRMPWPIHIFAGQPDANDPTKFRITYQSPDGPSTLIAQLGTDDRLTFTRPVATRP